MDFKTRQKDKNQDEIVDVLRKAGYHVIETCWNGFGVPDLNVSFPIGEIEIWFGVWVEIKMPGSRLRRKELEFFGVQPGPITYPGYKIIVHSPAEALERMTEIRKEVAQCLRQL